MSGLMPPNILSYLGEVAVPFINRTFSPDSSNYQFNVPTVWINTSTKQAYILVAKPQNVADWLQFASSAGAVDEFNVDTSTPPGTNPVLPNGLGAVTVTGGQVAAGTTANVIQTDSLAANTYTIQIQRSQAAASSTIADNGVSHFDSTYFTVDANGFVSFVGSGGAETLTGNSGGAVGPTLANINTVGTGSITIVGNPGTSTLTTELTGLTSHAVLVGAGTATITKVGPTATSGQVLQSQGSTTDPAFSTATYPATTTVNQILYSSSANVVAGLATADNGVLITSAAGVPSILADGTTGQVLTATTGSPPSWSSIVTGVSSVTGTANQILASPTTGNVVLSLIGPYTPATYTAHGVLVGEGTSSIVAVGPDATSGIPLISQGSSTDPTFGTAVVAGGGTGDTSFISFAPVCGGTSTTAPLQSASTGISTSGYVLTSNGSSALPSFQASSGVNSLEITMDAGTTPISPSSGAMVFTGAQVASGVVGANVIRTDGSASNAMTIQVQRSTTAASSTAADNGVCHFNSTEFAVDSNGFVTSNNITLVAGTGIALTPATGLVNLGGSITIAATTSTLYTYKNVNHGASPYTVLSTDEYLSVDCSAGTVTLNFANAPTTYQAWIVKDRTGSASTNNITITTPGGTDTIDGLTSFKMTSNYQAIQLIYNGTNYEVF